MWLIMFAGVHEAGGHEHTDGDTEDPQEDVHTNLQSGGLVVGVDVDGILKQIIFIMKLVFSLKVPSEH